MVVTRGRRVMMATKRAAPVSPFPTAITRDPPDYDDYSTAVTIDATDVDEGYLDDDQWLTVNGFVRTFTISPTASASYSGASTRVTLKPPTKKIGLRKTTSTTTPSTASAPSIWTTSTRRFGLGGLFETSTNKEPSLFLYPNEIDFESSSNDFSLFEPSFANDYTRVTSSNHSTLAAPPPISLDDTCQLGVSEMLAVTIMVLLTLSTICMNVIVIILFLSNKHIRSLGNMYYMSLAFADLFIGSIAMPLNIYMQVMCDMWPFSSIACDLFISFDVLSSTASIMHLCVIAIDRYKVIDDPLGYVRRLSRKRVFATIGGIWLAASAISFPGIAWWKTAGMAEHKTAFIDAKDGTAYLECYLAHEVTYIFVSSAVSFYIPLIAMSTVYYKIYQKAVAQSRFLSAGSKNVVTGDLRTTKRMISNGSDNSKDLRSKLAGRITLRAHRGGQQLALTLSTSAAQALRFHGTAVMNITTGNDKIHEKVKPQYSIRKNSSCLTVDSNAANYTIKQPVTATSSNNLSGSMQAAPGSRKIRGSRMVVRKSSLFSYQKSYTTFQKLRMILKEHKAARTLGLIMGVFILCWLPFFVLNILSAVMPSKVTGSYTFKIIFKTFTWCGYMNSVLNPFLYGVSNRTFRNIYINFLTCGRIRKKSKKGSSVSTCTTHSIGNTANVKSLKSFRPSVLAKEEQNSLEAALRDPKHQNAKQTMTTPTSPRPNLPHQQVVPISQKPPLPPPKQQVLKEPEEPWQKREEVGETRVAIVNGDGTNMEPEVQEMMTRSLTIEFPKRDIGHHSCYCQCADRSSISLLGGTNACVKNECMSTSTPILPPHSNTLPHPSNANKNSTSPPPFDLKSDDSKCASLTNTPVSPRKFADYLMRSLNNNNTKKVHQLDLDKLKDDVKLFGSFNKDAMNNNRAILFSIEGAGLSLSSRRFTDAAGNRIHSSLAPIKTAFINTQNEAKTRQKNPTSPPIQERSPVLLLDDCYDYGLLTSVNSEQKHDKIRTSAYNPSHCPKCNAELLPSSSAVNITFNTITTEPSPAHSSFTSYDCNNSSYHRLRTSSSSAAAAGIDAPQDLSLKRTSKINTSAHQLTTINRTSVL